MPPQQFSLLSSVLGLLFIDHLDVNRQNALGNFLVTMGQAILTSAAQQAVLESGQGERMEPYP